MPVRRTRQRPQPNIAPEQLEQLAEIERDAKRDADAYTALVEIERCLARARQAAGELAAVYAHGSPPAYYGTVGHVMAEHAHDLGGAIDEARQRAEVVGGKLRVRVGHRPPGQAWESAFLWRARWRGFDESVLADWLTWRRAEPSGDPNARDLAKATEARRRREQQRETLKRRMRDDYNKAAAAADQRTQVTRRNRP